MSRNPKRKPDPNRKPTPPDPNPPDPSPTPRKNTKLTGERSEADFQSAAIHRNFGVARPWGDSRRYDFILDNGRCLYRVQVKCTESIRMRAYETRATYSVGKGRAVYTKNDIDFIAAHVVPLDIFYIIPVEVCTPAPMLRFYPHRQARIMRLEPYREAWHLLEGTAHAWTVNLQAAADESIDDTIDEKINDTIDEKIDERIDEKVDDTIYEKLDETISAAAAADSDSISIPDTLPHVILSEGSAPRSGALPQSKDPYSTTKPDAPTTEATAINSQTKPVHLPPGIAPWPTPPLKIVARRQGKNILPEPPKD